MAVSYSNIFTKLIWVLLFSMMTVQIAKFVRYQQSTNVSYGMLDQLYDNLKSKPIKEFKAVPIDQIVPDSWEEVQHFKFPGMKRYCNCDGVYKDSCEPEKDGCTLMEKQKPAQLNNWRGMKLILRRFKKKEIEYVKLSKSGKNKGMFECPNGFKKCTPVHCVKDYIPCPITHFWLNKNRANWVEADSEKFDLGKDEIVMERKSDNNRIVNGFQLELNGMPCYNPNSTHRLVTKKGSSIANRLGGNGCSKPWKDNVEDYRSVDSLSFTQFCSTNGMKEYISKIPDTEIAHLLDESVHLTARYKLFLGIHEECTGFDIDRIYYFNVGITSIFNVTRAFIVFTVLVFLFLLLISKKGLGYRLMLLGTINGTANLAGF